ncbi:hypothetical protein EBR21_10175, partial [bacterium]|nr:hypothetical protein [bacterium]
MGTCANRTLEFCDISLWVALLICCNVTIACGNKPTSFNISSTSLGEESTKIKTDTGVDANKASKSQQDNQNVSSKRKNKVVERTRTLDTFLLPGNKYSKDEFAVPSQPFETSEFSQEIGISKVSNSIKVLEKTAPNANIVINGPVKSTYSHKVAWNNKPVDLYVVIDDSESFAGNPELRIRAKNLIAKLLKNMQGTDWRLYMSGLPGGKDDSLMLSATTIASGNIDQIIDEKVNDILKESAIGDEQTMRGLANLVTKYKAQDRNNAVHAYFIISDAPNCKDNANSNSQSCNLTSNSPDYYRYLFDQTGSVLGLGTYMQQMSLFGAYYRMTNNTNVCSKNDQVEVPTAGQVLKLNSQYAELSFFWQRALFPSTPLTNNPSWVGDICAESENTEFVNTLTNSIKSMAQHRFVLENSFQDFPQNPEYNFAIFDEAGATVENGVYRPQFNPLIILNEGIYANATLSAVGSTQNNYRKLDFLDTFDTEPRDQSVFVTWLDESGTQKSINCRVGVDFSKVTAPCRHDGKNLYFRNYDDLPKLLPNSTALSKNLTVKYERNVAQINSISFNTGESVIMPEQIQLVATTAQSDAKIPEYLISVQDSVVTLKFQANLPAGSYSVKYFDRSHQRFSVNIIHEID